MADEQHDAGDDQCEDDQRDEEAAWVTTASITTAEEATVVMVATVNGAPDDEADGEQHETAEHRQHPGRDVEPTAPLARSGFGSGGRRRLDRGHHHSSWATSL